jgi:hypothetical protein
MGHGYPEQRWAVPIYRVRAGHGHPYRPVLVTRFVETVLPARLGSGFRWLMASSWASNFGDGIAVAAGP